jgi:hypothetical protein
LRRRWTRPGPPPNPNFERAFNSLPVLSAASQSFIKHVLSRNGNNINFFSIFSGLFNLDLRLWRVPAQLTPEIPRHRLPLTIQPLALRVLHLQPSAASRVTAATVIRQRIRLGQRGLLFGRLRFGVGGL